jgi:HupE / UreJ protein
MRALVIALALVMWTSTAFAHKPSDAHVMLDADGDHLTGTMQISFRDLDAALALDNGDGELSWGELTAAEPRIASYVATRFSLDGCRVTFGAPALVDLSDGTYWTTPLEGTCTGDVESLVVRYSILFDIDARHRGLVHIGEQTVVIYDDQPVTIAIGAASSVLTFIKEGVWHIWIGFDHILFLLCLLLPAVFPRKGEPLTFKTVAIEVAEIVTAFTLAHSITLVISAVGLVSLPSRIVETAIAASVVLAALNNLVRAIDARWAVAFALGLLHGFGFSSVLLDLGLPSGELVGALLGFNLGVELGQAAIVIVTLPLLYFMRSTLMYRALVFAGSGATAVLASFWVYERIGG